MYRWISFWLLVALSHAVSAQYPFEKYPAIQCREFRDWKTYDLAEKENKIHFTKTVPGVYAGSDVLTIQLTSFTERWDSSFVRIFRGKKQIQKLPEPMFFTPLNMSEPVYVADFNGDSLADVKLIVSYLGNGLAGMNNRILYFFQQTDGTFVKLSFLDKLDGYRPERDFDGDGNFEIITQTLNDYQRHNYWTFNLYNFIDGHLVNVNSKHAYPIMIQYLFRQNFKVTDKISPEKMKTFSRPEPDDLFVR